MSKFAKFMKANKKQRENVFVRATETLIDPDTNKPLEWELRALDTKEAQRLQDECTIEIPIGRGGQYRTKLNTQKYVAKLLCASIVYPDLYDKELQDSYGVATPEELIKEMIDDVGEYNALVDFVQKYNHLDKTLNEKIEEAKN